MKKMINKVLPGVVFLGAILGAQHAVASGWFSGSHNLGAGTNNTDIILLANKFDENISGSYEITFTINKIPGIKNVLLKKNGSGVYSVDAYPANNVTLSAANHNAYYGNFNGDGVGDLLLQGQTSGQASLVVSGTNGKTAPAILQQINGAELGVGITADVAGTLTIIDINEDGLDDIQLVISGTTWTLLNNGNGIFGQAQQSVNCTDGAGSFDTDCDGVVDLYDWAPLNPQESVDTDGDGIGDGADTDDDGDGVLDVSDTTYPLDPENGTGIGAVPGTFSVSDNGKANYNIPIDVIPAAGDVVPKLSLQYSQQSGNGILGMGWYVSGLSSIERCSTSYAEDEYANRVNYDASDKFCLNGYRLVVINGTYGANNAEYRTEQESYSKIVSYDTQGNGPQYFRVWRKDGLIEEYGRTTDSRRTTTASGASGSVHTWALNEVRDREGWWAKYSYNHDTTKGTFTINEISYSGHDHDQSFSPDRKIVFVYETGPRNDITEFYTDNLKQRLEKRLAQIKLLLGNTWVRSYDLTYSYGPHGRSLLQNIETCYRVNTPKTCLPVTTFTWKTGDQNESKFGTGIAGSDTLGTPSTYLDQQQFVMDVNADGRNDLVWAYINGSSIGWKIYHGATSGTFENTAAGSGTFNVGSALGGTGTHQFMMGDVNGDDRADLVWAGNSGANLKKVILLANTAGNNFIDQGMELSGEGGTYDYNHFLLADINGDNRQDLLFIYKEDNLLAYSVYLSCFSCAGTNNSNNYDFEVTTYKEDVLAIRPAGVTKPNPKDYTNQTHTVGDVNGDGRADWVWSFTYGQGDDYQSWNNNSAVYHALFLSGPTGGKFQFVSLGKDPGYDYYFDRDVQFNLADVNGDGKSDLVYSYEDAKDKYIRWRVYLSTLLGTGFGNNTTPASVTPSFEGQDNFSNLGLHTNQQVQLVDINGDDRLDFVYSYRLTASSTFKWVTHLAKKDGAGFETNDLGGQSSLSVPATASASAYHFADVSGDGKADLVHTYGVGNDIRRESYLQPDSYAERISKITNGLGEEINITYKFMTDASVYTRGSDTTFTFPLKIDAPKSYLVSGVTRSDGLGTGVSRSWSYKYETAVSDLLGRGFLGFKKRTVTDHLAEFVTTYEYRLEYPYLGRLNSEVTKTDDLPSITVSETHNHWNAAALNGGLTTTVYLENSVTLKHALNDGAVVSVELTENTYNPTYGTLIESIVTTGKGFTGAINSSFSVTGQDSKVTTVNAYTHDTANWRLGFLEQQTVSYERSGEATKSVTNIYAPRQSDSASFLLGSKTEFLGSAVEKTTTYQRNIFGNITSEIVTGKDIGGGSMASRTTEYHDYVDRLYPTMIMNAESHWTLLSYNRLLGKIAESIDSNGLTTWYKYDGFGREIFKAEPDGTSTYTQYRKCTTGCPSNAAYKVTSLVKNRGSAGTGKPTVTTYIDKLNRVIRTSQAGFNGTAINIDTEYDARGRKYRVSEPYFAGNDVYWNEYGYDDLDRIISEVNQKRQSTVYGTTKTYTYTADTYVSQTNVNAVIKLPDNTTRSISTQTKFNTLGEMIETIDGLTIPTHYFYDAQGFLRKTKVNNDTDTEITIVTDVAGNKTSMDDPDAGSISYEYDAMGQLRRMTQDPGGLDHVTVNTYDKLGRILTQEHTGAAADELTTWTYDTQSIGHVATITVSQDETEVYNKLFEYDSLSRLKSEQIRIHDDELPGKDFSYSYDAFSRLNTKTYPSGFAVKHAYNANGYKVSIADKTSAAMYWQASAMDERGNITAESYGNGVSTTRSFYPNSGLAQTIVTGVSGNTTKFQNLSYEWDSAANLYKRRSASTGEDFSETFDYDNGHRLKEAITTVVTGGAPNRALEYDYDPLGNIIAKTGVGTYTYSGTNAGPHAVTSTTGAYANSYGYDAKGNMTTNGSKTLTYTVYNLPASISDSVSANTVSFIYGPGEQLIYQTAIANGITTTSKYYEGEYEEVQQGDTIRAKTTVAGVLLYTTVRKAGSWAKGYDISYVHGDHLGSTDSITNKSATLDTRMLFDPFGGRRQPSGADADQAYLDSLQELTFETTSNGFTGHEQIDSVTLVHMGGRMYDPTLGRFLSPDSVVQYPEISQSYNRYSYVRNNPLSLVDPSGESDTGNGEAVPKADGKGEKCEGDGCPPAGTDPNQTPPQKDGRGSDDATANVNQLPDEIDEYNQIRGRTLKIQQEAVQAGETGAEILDPFDPFNVVAGKVVKIAKVVLVGTGIIKVVDDVANWARSPHIDPKDIAGKTPEQIDALAKNNGLITKGADPKSGKGAYIDPVTGEQRILTHPKPDSGCSGPHCHVNNSAGERLDINGNVVSPKSPDGHLPLNYP